MEFGHHPIAPPPQMGYYGYWDPYHHTDVYGYHEVHDMHDLHDVHDHPVMGDLDPSLWDHGHHESHGDLYQHEDEHFGLDFNRRHSMPLDHHILSPFFEDGQDQFLHHGHHPMGHHSMDHHSMGHHPMADGIPGDCLAQDGMKEGCDSRFHDESANDTYEDYFNHLAGFDEHVHVPHHYIETGNFHMNMMMNVMSTMPGGGPIDETHPNEAYGTGVPVDLNAVGQGNGCWVKANWRGAARKIDGCDSKEEELQSGYCYKKCQDGYTGYKSKCYRDCPDNLQPSSWRSLFGYCKPPNDERRPMVQGPCAGCIKLGSVYFGRCPGDTKPVSGSDKCTAHCPQGTTPASFMGCKKKTYTRASHKAMCNPNTQTQSRTGLWCYPKCENGGKGFGPLCLGSCPSNMTSCAGLLCLAPGQDSCITVLTKFGSQIQKIMQSETMKKGAAQLPELVQDMNYPTCPAW